MNNFTLYFLQYQVLNNIMRDQLFEQVSSFNFVDWLD